MVVQVCDAFKYLNLNLHMYNLVQVLNFIPLNEEKDECINSGLVSLKTGSAWCCTGTFFVNTTSVLRINICVKNRLLTNPQPTQMNT